MAHLPASTIRNRLWVPAVAVRVVVVGLLLAGPWTDEPAELEGWDAERFQEIAERDGAAWVDEPIEYPPGSVVLLDRLAGDDVVSTNRRLVAASAVLEALGVLLLWRAVGADAAKAFLVLGLPLVPMGLMRLDMAVTVVALAAVVALLWGDRRAEPERRSRTPDPATVAFATLVAAGAMIKLWPALLLAAAWAVGRRGAMVAAAIATGLLGLAWLAIVGDGLAPVDHVLSLRGATGWHVESLPGAVLALATDTEPRLELNAFRIGTLNQPLVTLGRVGAIAVIGLLAAVAARNRQADPRRMVALVMLGATAALLITAPLLSPQFLLWLTPWGALLLAGDDREPLPARDRAALGLVATAVVLTGATLTVFDPPRLAEAVPAALLTVRNLALLALPPACLAAIAQPAGTGRDRAGSDLVKG